MMFSNTGNNIDPAEIADATPTRCACVTVLKMTVLLDDAVMPVEE
jgi:hypothetical protein